METQKPRLVGSLGIDSKKDTAGLIGRAPAIDFHEFEPTTKLLHLAAVLVLQLGCTFCLLERRLDHLERNLDRVSGARRIGEQDNRQDSKRNTAHNGVLLRIAAVSVPSSR